MQANQSAPRYTPLTMLIEYARPIITRANIRCGSEPKILLLNACDERLSIYDRMHEDFAEHLRDPRNGVLGHPRFVRQMRSETLRRLANVSYDHQQIREADKKVTPTNQSRLNWADNPNGFIRMAQYLIIVAELNDEYIRNNLSIGIESTLIDAHNRMDELLRRPIRRTRQRQLGLPGPRR